MVDTARPQRRGLLLPVILIVLGLTFLSVQVGWLGWGDLWTVLNLWPLALIAVGADLLTGRAYSVWIALGTIALAVAVLFGAFGDAWGASATAQTVDRPLGGAASARVEIQTGVAALRLDGHAAADRLIAGEVATGVGERLVQDFRMAGETAVFMLRSEQRGVTVPGFGLGNRTWELSLSNRTPMDLRIDTGVGRADLDLRDLQLTRLGIGTGVGAMTIDLPAFGRYDATVDTGVGATTIRIPSGTAVRIATSRGLGAIHVTGNLDRNGDQYVSPSWSTAEHRVDLRVNSGVGAVSIRVGN